MEQRYFFELSYNGAAYAGWQIQPHTITVQETIEQALSKLFSNRLIKVVGCGRTDAGVHASKYFLHTDLPTTYAEEQIRYKLNKILPADIAIHHVQKVSADAHARFDALSRTYIYKINTDKNPFCTGLSWYYPLDLDLDKMNEASQYLLGKQDFTSLSKLHTDVKTNFCEVTKAVWEQTNENEIQFTITANRFLRNMVRASVGTLIDVGRGNFTPIKIKKILAAKNRSEAGTSSPAHGLYLADITYN